MAQNRSNFQYQTRTSYIDGNTARKRELSGRYAVNNYNTAYKAAPVTEPKIREHARPERQVRTQPKGLSGISKASLFVLTLAIGATLYFCIEFLMLQNEVSRLEKDIITMEKTLATMKNENDAAYEQINMVYDLDYVYNVAVNELGMVYPNNNEVITYKKAEESYIRQYADIPD
ncbi:septum formation initiator [Herbinix hemicellulosilytica]|uniref:Putative membrane protein n=1 Tax=Herbinix hemicellulosilytica TaxID=1564487 RepID=A0A0H5SIN3_HERHM|nr:septum formation initiator family protein [Herbinix hemicellulosilytica]RBP56789.1 septum formation initiator [Herbinix hemicellulosilytica]CRZ34651.1 putative membrane protein [Herbinix hemicellulosilytica]